MIVLGLDPGIDRLGWAIINETEKTIELVKYGLITTDKKASSSSRLGELALDLAILIKEYKPNLMCVEKLFFSVNAKTAMLIAEVRGVIKATGANAGLSIIEVHPMQLKKRLTGTGKAKKKEVQEAVSRIFEIKSDFKTDDVADAIGIGYVGLLEEIGQL